MEYFTLPEAAKILGMSVDRILREAESGHIELEERCLYSDDVSEVIGYYKLATNDVTRVLTKPGDPYDQVLWSRQRECPGAKLSRTADIKNIVVFEHVLNDYISDGGPWLNSNLTNGYDESHEVEEDLSPTIKPRVERIKDVVEQIGSTKRRLVEEECLNDPALFTGPTFDVAWRVYRRLFINNK